MTNPYKPYTYTLTLSEEDMRTITAVGYRYCWSNYMESNLWVGDNQLSEAETWALQEEINKDTEGGHSSLPMLAEDSSLHQKLTKLLDSIV